ncbi:MAG TPA: copper chaperone PCu(A)C [Streptosporangiaceae bacterium]|nr:copper chaperone PCu(A)C [Streptosporangiaceae bacterium]
MLETDRPAAHRRGAANSGSTLRQDRQPARPRRASAGRLPARTAGAACVIAAAAALLAGCAQPASSGPTIQIGTAYVQQPDPAGTTDAYLVIENNGSADRLLSASTSAGGRVALRGPAARLSASASDTAMQTVPDIRIPADQTTRLAPNGFHLLITGARPMQAGHEITLTLVFARAGPISVAAEVTNPQSGGSSYFIN